MFLEELFLIENAKSGSFNMHDEGDIKFVSNGDYDNSIVGFVSPLEEDKIFNEECICVSSFCQAVIHSPPFIARGNGGSGLVILTPKNPMTKEELFYYAAQINLVKWRFSYGRMVIKNRLKNIELIPFKETLMDIDSEVESLLPNEVNTSFTEVTEFKYFKIKDLCSVSNEKFFSLRNLEEGNTPYVTTTSFDNGVKSFVNEDPIYNKYSLSVSLNGSVGEVFFQVDDFISNSDNAVLYLNEEYEEYNPYLLLYVGALLKIHKWRYNYYRKLKLTELKNLEIPIPIIENGINMDYIIKLLDTTYCWDIVKSDMLG